MEHCPELAGIFELLYKECSNIWLRNNEDEWEAAIAEEGCVQGCALGPFIFGFATLPSYKRTSAILKDKPNSFFRAYSDDSTIGDVHDDAINAFDTLKEGLKSCGLKINFRPHKTVVLLGHCNDDLELQRRIQNFRDRGFHEDNIIELSVSPVLDSIAYASLCLPEVCWIPDVLLYVCLKRNTLVFLFFWLSYVL